MGGHIVKEVKADERECQDFCQETDDCQHFVFVKSSRMCHLRKFEHTKISRNPGQIVSGPRTCPGNGEEMFKDPYYVLNCTFWQKIRQFGTTMFYFSVLMA